MFQITVATSRLRSKLKKKTLSTIDAEVIHGRCRNPVRIECNVEGFVYEEVVAIPLSDDAEIIDQRLLNSHLGIELVLGDARGLVLFSSSLAVPVISWGWK